MAVVAPRASSPRARASQRSWQRLRGELSGAVFHACGHVDAVAIAVDEGLLLDPRRRCLDPRPLRPARVGASPRIALAMFCAIASRSRWRSSLARAGRASWPGRPAGRGRRRDVRHVERRLRARPAQEPDRRGRPQSRLIRLGSFDEAQHLRCERAGAGLPAPWVSQGWVGGAAANGGVDMQPDAARRRACRAGPPPASPSTGQLAATRAAAGRGYRSAVCMDAAFGNSEEAGWRISGRPGRPFTKFGPARRAASGSRRAGGNPRATRPRARARARAPDQRRQSWPAATPTAAWRRQQPTAGGATTGCGSHARAHCAAVGVDDGGLARADDERVLRRVGRPRGGGRRARRRRARARWARRVDERPRPERRQQRGWPCARSSHVGALLVCQRSAVRAVRCREARAHRERHVARERARRPPRARRRRRRCRAVQARRASRRAQARRVPAARRAAAALAPRCAPCAERKPLYTSSRSPAWWSSPHCTGA